MRVRAQAAGIADRVHDGGLLFARRDDDDELLFLLHGDAELLADAFGILPPALEDRSAHGAGASGRVDGVAAVAVAERDPDGGVTGADLHIGHIAIHPFFDLLFYRLAHLVVQELEHRSLQPRDRDCQHDAAAALGVDPLYVALPSYVVIMGGGALVNLGFCFIRLAKVKDLSLKADFSLAKPLITHNVLLSALGGLMWYLQFFFYAWGHARIPAQYDYISWMLHMSFYVLCGGIVGLVLKEWNNAGRRPVTVLSLGCVVIIVAANIVGIGMAN